MGRRGPPPKPAKVLQLTGNPGHRRRERLEMSEFAPPLELPRPPRELGKAERAEYWRLGKVLLARGTICALDRGCLTMLAVETVRWELLLIEIAALPVEERVGALGLALGRLADKTARNVLALSKMFGLTPASRGAVAPSGPSPPPKGQRPAPGGGWEQFS